MNDLIRQAQRGDSQARDALLSQIRPRLRQWAENALNARFAARLDASDLAQVTLLEVHEKLGQFVGGSEGEFLDWLRRMLDRNIVDAVRWATAQKRTIDREQKLDGQGEDGEMLRNQLPGDQSSPSIKAIQNESVDRLQQALAQLLPDQRIAVQMVHLEQQPLAAAAEKLDRSSAATAKLLQRGIANLRRLLHAPEGDAS
jgi:RNA polymerase sigma-70 factor (ECF subfamily)